MPNGAIYRTCPCGHDLIVGLDAWKNDFPNPATCGHCMRWEHWRGAGWRSVPIVTRIRRRARAALTRLRLRLGRTD